MTLNKGWIGATAQGTTAKFHSKSTFTRQVGFICYRFRIDLKPTKTGPRNLCCHPGSLYWPYVIGHLHYVKPTQVKYDCVQLMSDWSTSKNFLLPESFLALNLTISSPILRRRRPRARSKTRAGAGPPARTRPQARARSRDGLPSREESLCSQVGTAERTRQATMEVIETFSFPRSSCLYFLPWSQ